MSDDSRKIDIPVQNERALFSTATLWYFLSSKFCPFIDFIFGRIDLKYLLRIILKGIVEFMMGLIKPTKLLYLKVVMKKAKINNPPKTYKSSEFVK